MYINTYKYNGIHLHRYIYVKWYIILINSLKISLKPQSLV